MVVFIEGSLLIPLAEPNLSGNEARYLQECVDANFVSSVGPFVKRFESMVAESTGSKSAVATSSGTAGLHLALSILGVAAGDLVIMPSYTFVASASAVAQCGAQGWLFDLDPESWTLNPLQVRRSISEFCRTSSQGLIHVPTGKRVSAIMPVYTLGNTADMASLEGISREYRIPLVADAAAALGATYRGRSLGVLADLSVASFNGNKTFTCGGGGAVFGIRDELLTKAKHLSTTARVGENYEHDEIGFNYRMTNVEAALGCAQLERQTEFLQKKTAVAGIYRELAEGLPGIEPFPDPGWGTSASWMSGIVASSPKLARHLRESLTTSGIEARPFWKPMHLQVPYRNWQREALNYTDDIWQRVVILPSSTGISESQLDEVVERCRAALLQKA